MLVKPVSFLYVFLLFLFWGCSKKEVINTSPADQLQTVESTAVQEENTQELKKASGSKNEIVRNPFLTDEESKEFSASSNAIPIEGMDLSIVGYAQDNLLSHAVINGMVVKVGDMIGNKKIIEIEREAVKLKDKQGEYIIMMKNK